MATILRMALVSWWGCSVAKSLLIRTPAVTGSVCHDTSCCDGFVVGWARWWIPQNCSGGATAPTTETGRSQLRGQSLRERQTAWNSWWWLPVGATTKPWALARSWWS